MQTVNRLDMLRSARAAMPGRVALVPTMGALHAGHLALVEAARKAADHVIVSIFVNPRQFGAGEDLAAYPRTLARDTELLEPLGVDAIWAPSVEEVYPAGFATVVSVGGPSEGLCGAARPGHFDGVGTVVLKLFNQVRPDLAFFGEKDWQQLAVIRRMARDLDLLQPAVGAIHAVPTQREPDGLALSSRNAYLDSEQRRAASALPRAMREAAEGIRGGAAVDAALLRLQKRLLEAGFAAIDYADLRDGEDLSELGNWREGARLFVAARIGKTRLIDNIAV